MKKIYISTAAVFIAATAFVTQSLAAAPTITVKSDKSDVVYTYTSSSDSNEASADASKLFDGFYGTVVESYTAAELTITSESNDSDNVEVVLRFSTDKTDMEYSVLDYYDFRITAENGDVIYDSDDAEPTATDITEKDISFGIFNEESESDTKKFAVEYKIDEDLSTNIDEEALESLNITIVSKIVNSENTEADYNVTITAETPEIPTVVEAASDSEPTETTGNEENPDVTMVEYQKTCGTDISAGDYKVTGKGMVTITGADGTIKSTTIINSDVEDSNGSVPVALVQLVDGDVITVLPLEGEEKPSIKFEKKSSGAAAATPAPTARAERAASTPEPRKSNPQTGEESAHAAVLCSIMFTAAAAICILEIIKRKKINN